MKKTPTGHSGKDLRVLSTQEQDKEKEKKKEEEEGEGGGGRGCCSAKKSNGTQLYESQRVSEQGNSFTCKNTQAFACTLKRIPHAHHRPYSLSHTHKFKFSTLSPCSSCRLFLRYSLPVMQKNTQKCTPEHLPANTHTVLSNLVWVSIISLARPL